MVVASLPATQTKSSDQLTRREKAILRALMKGYDTGTIARKLAGDSPNQRTLKRLRTEVRAVAARSEEWLALQHTMARVALAENLEGAGDGIGKMAKRGRAPQAKLLMEATGFYTPHSRQEVEHSGEISISLKGVPRPTRTEDHIAAELGPEAIEDAEVVD